MTEELKTLNDWVKDITEPNIMKETTCVMVREDFVKEQFIEDVERLRAEAVKINNTDVLSMMNYLGLEDFSDLEFEAIKVFNKRFFNLTEEDLK